MSWITVDTKLGNHPKMAALPSDAARYGWILTLLEAKEQRTPGTFASEKHYRHVMPRHGRFLPDYIKAGLIDLDDDGTLHVHDWQRHQWSVAKAKQRGHDEDIGETSEGQKEDASRAVPVYVSNNVEEEGPREPERPDDEAVFSAIAKAGAYVRPESGMGRRIIGLVGRRGADVVLAELAEMVKVGGQLSDRQIVFGLEERLEPVRPPKPEPAPVQEGPSQGDRIYERMHARRLERYHATGEWPEEWGEKPKEASAA